MQPIVTTVTSFTPGVERFLKSLDNLKDSAEVMLLEFGEFPLASKFTQTAVVKEKYFPEDKYPGNLNRFFALEKFLDPERFYLFCDAADTVFQTPLPELVHEGIYVAPEWEVFNRESWFASLFDRYRFNSLWEQPIFNMGSWAMNGENALDLIDFLKNQAFRFDYNQFCDQPLFDLWLLSHHYTINPELFGCLYNGWGRGMIRVKNGQFVTNQGAPICLVHGNGNTKELLEGYGHND